MSTHSKHRRRTGAESGFTVIELVACIVILGILGAIAAPSFFNNQTFTNRGYADELASSLRYAQRVAIATSCRVTINITAAGYTGLQPQAQAGCPAAALTRAVVRPDGTNLTGTTPTGVAVNPAVNVLFLANGAPAGGAASITVGTRVVNVEAVTGRVSTQ